MRVGLGFDVHVFSKGHADDGPLVLGGVTVDGPGLVGHSDADVVAHAVADALLGAAGLDDLGTMFPATDAAYKGVSSITLLSAVTDRVAESGWRVVNVDVVVAAEVPALAPHLEEMRANLSAVVGAPVSVKPKRAEGLGAIGRGEGIAAWAVALLESSESGGSA